MAGDGSGAGPGVALGERTEACRERASRVGVRVPFSASWVSMSAELVKSPAMHPGELGGGGVRVGQWPGGELEQLGEGGPHGEEEHAGS